MRTGVIHDLGYQRYTGPRFGRGYAFRTLYSHTLRTSFGLGRGVKAKIFSWTIIGIITLVAVVLTAIGSQSSEPVMTSPMFVDNMATLTILLLAAVAPELTSRDQQTRVLGLYLARPMRREDYALARLAGAVTAIFLVLAGPVTLMFAGAALSTDKGASGVGDAAVDWLQGVAHSATHALVLGSISLLAAALIRRRAIAAAAVVAVFLVGLPAVGVAAELSGSQGATELVSMVAPVAALSYLDTWLYGGSDLDIVHGPWLLLYVVAVIAACTALLVIRYRKVPA